MVGFDMRGKEIMAPAPAHSQIARIRAKLGAGVIATVWAKKFNRRGRLSATARPAPPTSGWNSRDRQGSDHRRGRRGTARADVEEGRGERGTRCLTRRSAGPARYSYGRRRRDSTASRSVGSRGTSTRGRGPSARSTDPRRRSCTAATRVAFSACGDSRSLRGRW